jgi:serine/threonine protein phosphatase PrpC
MSDATTVGSVAVPTEAEVLAKTDDEVEAEVADGAGMGDDAEVVGDDDVEADTDELDRVLRLTCTVPHIAVGHLAVGGLEVRAASVRGAAHTAAGDPRQDAFGLLATPDGRWLCCGVADGVGSQPYSGFGADAALGRGLGTLADELAEGGAVGDPTRVVRAAGEGARRRATDLRVAPLAVSTTIVLAALEIGAASDGDRACSVISVGDSHALVLHADRRWTYLTPRDAAGPSNVVHDHLPEAPEGAVQVDARLGPGDVLVLATDGFTTPLGDGTHELGRELAERWSPRPRRLVPFLVDLLFEGHHDDRTVVAVWCPIRRPAEAPASVETEPGPGSEPESDGGDQAAPGA